MLWLHCGILVLLCILIVQIAEALDKMSDEVIEVVGSVDDLEDGQYVDISLLSVKKITAMTFNYFMLVYIFIYIIIIIIIIRVIVHVVIIDSATRKLLLS